MARHGNDSSSATIDVLWNRVLRCDLRLSNGNGDVLDVSDDKFRIDALNLQVGTVTVLASGWAMATPKHSTNSTKITLRIDVTGINLGCGCVWMMSLCCRKNLLETRKLFASVCKPRVVPIKTPAHHLQSKDISDDKPVAASDSRCRFDTSHRTGNATMQHLRC